MSRSQVERKMKGKMKNLMVEAAQMLLKNRL